MDSLFESFQAPVLRNDSANHRDVLTDATVWVLAGAGVDDFDLTALARWARMSRQAITNRWSRAEVIEIVVTSFQWRWEAWSCCQGVAPLRLPRTRDERLGVRVHEAVVELARGEEGSGRPAAAAAVRERERREHEHVRRWLLRAHRTSAGPEGPAGVDDREPGGPAVAAVEAEGLLAVTVGLRRTLSLDPERLELAAADDLLRRATRAAVERCAMVSADDGRGPLDDPAQVTAVEGAEDPVVRRPEP